MGSEAAVVEAIMMHNKNKGRGSQDAEDPPVSDAGADLARLGGIFGLQIGGASAQRVASSTPEDVLNAMEQSVNAMLSAQKAFWTDAERRKEKLDEQSRQLMNQVRALKQQIQREAASGVTRNPPDGVSCASGSWAIPEEQDGGDQLRENQPQLRKGSSVVSITEQCGKEPSGKLDEGNGEPRWIRWVHSANFDLLVGVLIVANTLFMSLELEYLGNKLERQYILCEKPPCESDWSWPWVEESFVVMEHVFTTLFLVELSTRLAADGRKYLKNWANAGDALIVLVSSADSWVITPVMKANGSSGMGNVAILRLVRLVRLSKVFRVVRVMKAFKSLRVLVSAVAASVGALAWSMTLLFVLELMGAIFLSQVLRPFIEEPERDQDSRKFLFERFGTWVRAMLTVFEITMAPGGFLQYRRVAEEVHPIFGLIFAGYVCVVTFAVVRVITAMFLKATLSASDQDEAKIAHDRAHSRELYAQRLKEALQAEGDNDSIDQEEFKQLLEIERMRDWLDEVELHDAGAERLFKALEHGNGRASFSEFVVALQRMRGPPRSADSIVTLFESRWILERLQVIEQAMRKEYGPMPTMVKNRTGSYSMSSRSTAGGATRILDSSIVNGM